MRATQCCMRVAYCMCCMPHADRGYLVCLLLKVFSGGGGEATHCALMLIRHVTWQPTRCVCVCGNVIDIGLAADTDLCNFSLAASNYRRNTLGAQMFARIIRWWHIWCLFNLLHENQMCVCVCVCVSNKDMLCAKDTRICCQHKPLMCVVRINKMSQQLDYVWCQCLCFCAQIRCGHKRLKWGMMD